MELKNFAALNRASPGQILLGECVRVCHKNDSAAAAWRGYRRFRDLSYSKIRKPRCSLSLSMMMDARILPDEYCWFTVDKDG